MTPAEEYQLNQGTVYGEMRYEVFQKHGEVAYNTAHYGWHHSRPTEDTEKIYTLVNSDPVKFLVATVTYPMMDITPIDPATNQKLDIPAVVVPDFNNPTHLHLSWKDANIPFASKDELDASGTSYTLP